MVILMSLNCYAQGLCHGLSFCCYWMCYWQELSERISFVFYWEMNGVVKVCSAMMMFQVSVTINFPVMINIAFTFKI